MKKYLLYIPVALALFGMASCSQDRDPKYHDPTPGSFKLNNPVMMDQEIALAAGNTLEFTCSQPDYGFAATASYNVDVSLTEDFTNVYTLTPIDENSTRISVNQSDVATGICTLLGLDSEEAFNAAYPDGDMPVMKAYFRANCRIPGIESSAIASNVVSYNYLKPYFAVAVPGYIYLIGDVSGWVEPAESNAATLASWRLMEDDDAIGSKIYKGKFDISPNPTFRFYAALTGWDGGDSYGTQEDDNAIQFPEFSSGLFEHALVKGKGSFNFPNWQGGSMNMVVNMSDPNQMTVTFSSGDTEIFVASYIYLVGGYNGWEAPCVDNRDKFTALANSQGTPNIYSATVEVPAGEYWFRFCTQLSEDAGGWGPTIGWQEPDEGAVFDFTNNHFSGSFVNPGSGSWCFDMPSEGNFTMLVDMDNQTVDYTFEPK